MTCRAQYLALGHAGRAPSSERTRECSRASLLPAARAREGGGVPPSPAEQKRRASARRRRRNPRTELGAGGGDYDDDDDVRGTRPIDRLSAGSTHSRSRRCSQHTHTSATILALNVSNATLGASAVVAQPDARSLYLANLNFVEVFSASLASFQSIMSFACSNCQLQDVPSAIFELRELKECRLHNNLLQKLPTQFEDSQIEILDLAQNKFAAVPETIWRMRKLRTLDLSSNQVAACVDPLSPQPLNASLTSLILDQNPISEIACSLPNLQSISLQRMRALRSIPELVFRLPKLRKVVLSGNAQLRFKEQSQVSLSVTELHLASCELTSAPMQVVDAMPALRVFNLSSNKIASLGLTAESAPSKLQVLDLTGNRLADLSAIVTFAPALAELRLASNVFSACNLSSPQSSLEILNLSSNTLKSCAIALPKLRVLDLRDNQLQAVPPSTLVLPSLDELYLTGNPINPWTLSEDQREFLANLSRFVIQQSAFASCPIEEQQNLHGYKVCVTPMTLPPLPTGTPLGVPNNSSADDSSNALKSSRSDKFQIAYILASFLLALVIGVVVYRAMMKKGSTKPATVVSSPGSVAFLESPARFSDDVLIFPAAAYAEIDPEDEVIVDSSSSWGGGAADSSDNQSHSARLTSNFRPAGSDNDWVDNELLAWRVDYDSVRLDACLSSTSSAFVEVWEATYRLDKVAVKKLKPSRQLFYQKHAEVADPVVLAKFIAEVKVLSHLDHPRIVAFYGVAWRANSPILCVMEYLPQHDLHTFLQLQRGLNVTGTSARSSASTLALQGWGPEKLHIALDVLEALAYMHSLDPVLVHCDLNSRNVLLDNALRAKLSNFGISKYLGASGAPPTRTSSRRAPSRRWRGTSAYKDGDDDPNAVVADEMRHLLSQSAESVRWVAPEVLLAYTHYSEAVDVYAFGVLLCELDTLQLPYDDLRSTRDGRPMNAATIRKKVAKGELRPRFSPACPREVLEIADLCLAFDPHDRRSSAELAELLRTSAASLLSQRSTLESLKPQRISRANSSPSSSSVVSSAETDWSRRTLELKPDWRL